MRLWNISLYLDCDELGSEYEKVFNNHVAYLNYYLSLEIRKKKIEFDVCNTIGIYAGYPDPTPVIDRVPKDILQIGVDFDKERYERISGTSDCSYYGELIINGLKQLGSEYTYIVDAAKEIISEFIAGGCIVEKNFKSITDKTSGIRTQLIHCHTTNDYTLRARFVDTSNKKVICKGVIIRTLPFFREWKGDVKSLEIDNNHVIILNRSDKKMAYIDLALIKRGEFNYQFCEDWVTDVCMPLYRYTEMKNIQWTGDISKTTTIPDFEYSKSKQKRSSIQVFVRTDKSLEYLECIDSSSLKYFDYDSACIWHYISAQLHSMAIECDEFSRIEITVGKDFSPVIENCNGENTLKIGVKYDEEMSLAAHESRNKEYYYGRLKAGINKIDDRYKYIKCAIKEALRRFIAEGERFDYMMQEFRIGNINAQFRLVCDSNLFSVKGTLTDCASKTKLCEGNFISTLPNSDLIPNIIKDIVVEGNRIFIRNTDNQYLFYIDLEFEWIKRGIFFPLFCESPYRDDDKTRDWYNTIGRLQTMNFLR